MDVTRDSETECSKSERQRTYGTNYLFHRKENHGLGEWTCDCWGGGGGGWSGVAGELGVNR